MKILNAIKNLDKMTVVKTVIAGGASMAGALIVRRVIQGDGSDILEKEDNVVDFEPVIEEETDEQ